MRKSFTLLLSTLFLCVFAFSSFAQTLTLTPTGDNVQPTTTDLVVDFGEAVNFTTNGGTLTIQTGATAPVTTIKTIPLSTGSASATISGNKLVVKHGLTLQEGTKYWIGITSNAIVDFDGIEPANWGFTIGDYSAPVVESLDPEGTNIDVKADGFALEIEFDDDVIAGENKMIWLYRADGTVVDIIKSDGDSVTIDGNTATIKINENAFRDELTEYYVNIAEGAFVNDSNEVAFAGIMDNTTWTFTSRDYTAPFVDDANFTDISYTSATLNVTISEEGSVWYAYALSDATAPTFSGDYTEVAVGDGNAVSIPLTGLAVDSKYTVYIVAENADGDQQDTPSKFEFETLDNIEPTASNNTEITDANNVTVGLELTFDEKVVAGEGDLVVRRAGTNEAVRTIPAADDNFTVEEVEGEWIVTVLFEGLAGELSEKDYYVVIPIGYFEDESGNKYESDFTDTDDWTFTASDHTAPTVDVSIDETGGAGSDNNILVEFDDDVQLIDDTDITTLSTNADWFDYLTVEQNNTVVTFTADYSNGTITINPATLAPNTTYVVKLRANAFEDDNNNAFSAVHTSYEVTTKDFSDGVITLLPASGTDDAPRGTQPTITFSKEPMYVGGTSPVAVSEENIAGSVTFTDATDTDVDFDVEWDAATYTLTVVPAEELESEATYNLAFDGDDVEDVVGDVFTGTTTSAFTMVDYIVPVATLSHTGNVTNMPADTVLTIDFDEEVMQPDSSVIDVAYLNSVVIFRQNGPDGNPLEISSISWDATEFTIEIIPANDLQDGKVYYYGISAGVVSDGVNTNDSALVTFTFAPDDAPTGLQVAEDGYDPAIDETNVDMSDDDFVATITFERAAKPAPSLPAGTVATLYHASTDTVVATAPIDAAGFEGAVLTLTFDISGATIGSEVDYYIVVPADVAVANDDNDYAFAGVAAEAWTFTSADNVAPVLTTYAPTGTDVALDADVTIEFVEANDLSAGTGDITIESNDGEDVITVAVTDVEINNATNTITVPHADFAQYDSVYTVTVPVDAFVDESGNGNEDELTWTFTTVANPAPTIISLTPEDEEDMVAAGTDQFVIEFSEEVMAGESGTSAFLFEVGTGEDRAELTGNGTAIANDDIQRGAILVDNATDVIIDGAEATLDFGFALEEGKEYFILVENGMFLDANDAAFVNTLYVYDGWNFFTYDATAPTWKVTYDVLGDGMDINSDIVIAFNKPVDFDNAEITNTQITNIVNVTVDGSALAFTGTINEGNDTITLENSSFVPALTEANSEDEVIVTLDSGFRGIGNDSLVTATVEPFTIADYEEPTVTLTLDSSDGDSFVANISSDDKGTLYWIYQEGAASDAVTVEDVMAGTAITGYVAYDDEEISAEGLQSETIYTVYGVAVDENENVSEIDTLRIFTSDVTGPFVVEKTNTFTTGGVLTITFSENVRANGAKAYIREAGTLKLIETVTLAGTGSTDLTLTSSEVLAYADDQKFIVEVEGGVVTDDMDGSVNTWIGQIGLGDNAWVVGLADDTAPVLLEIDPDITATPEILVDVDAVFTLTFDEDVQLTDDHLIEFKVRTKTGGTYETDWELFELLDASSIDIDGSVVTLNLSRDFAPSARYELKALRGSFEDLAGNEYDVLINDFFSTKAAPDETAPEVTFNPADGATGINKSRRNLSITFDEEIVLLDGSAIDNFDLDTLVYVRKGTEDVPHTAEIFDTDSIAITLDVTEDLEAGAEYTYGFEAAFMDVAENEVEAGSATFTVATVAEEESFITFDPDNNAAEPTPITVDQVFRIIFNGQLYTYSTVAAENNIAVTPSYLEDVIILTDEYDDTISFSASIETWNEDTTIVAVTPDDVLVGETGYDLYVVDDMVQIGVGASPLAGDSIDYITEDVEAPDAVAFYPEHENTVPQSAIMSISFDEDVQSGTGTIEIRKANGEVVLTIDAATELSVNGNLVEITELDELEVGQEYFVLIPSGAITDVSDNLNPWEGITGEDEWTFTVSDVISSLQRISFAPVGTNALVNTDLEITFGQEVQLGTEGFIAIYTADGVAVELIRVNDGADQYNINGKIVTVNIADLEQNTRYQVEVAEGTFAVKDSAHIVNDAISRSMWTFTTEINLPPVLLADGLTPADNATDVSLRTMAEMRFDIDVQAGTGDITLHLGGAGTIVHTFDVNSDEVTFEGNVVTFNLEGLLEANNTDYYIIVPEGAITNISEVPEPFEGLEQMSSWNFTTQEDGVAPELVTWSPDEVELDDNHPVFVMEFNEDVVLVNGANLTVTEVGSEEPALVIALTEDMIVDSVITVTYDPRTMGELKYGTEYFVTVDGGAIEDLSENIWEGVTDNTVWTFFTKDLNVTIAEIQGTGSSSPMMGELVKVTGTITAISAGEGFFVQDANEAWSGIWVAYNDVASLSIGDGVVVVGSVIEPAQVTGIRADEVTVIDAPLTVEPVVVDAPSDVKAEMYESVLVQVNGARATGANDNGVWEIYYETFDKVSVNDWFYEYAPEEGHFYNVAGVVNARLGNFRLEPRMESDIYDITVETSVPEVSGVEFKVYPNPFNDRINVDNSHKLTRVVITNIAGQRVMDVKYPEREIRTADLVSGVYVISLFTEDGMVKSDRIVKR